MHVNNMLYIVHEPRDNAGQPQRARVKIRLIVYYNIPT